MGSDYRRERVSSVAGVRYLERIGCGDLGKKKCEFGLMAGRRIRRWTSGGGGRSGPSGGVGCGPHLGGRVNLVGK